MYGFDSTSIEISEMDPQIATADPALQLWDRERRIPTSQLARYVTTLANSGTRCGSDPSRIKITDASGNTPEEPDPVAYKPPGAPTRISGRRFMQVCMMQTHQ